jgi:hypothetical protein
MKIQDVTEGYGRYYCSTDKKWKTRKGPKQTRKVAEGSFKDASPMTKDTVKTDRIRSLKNLISIAKEQGRQLRVQELELELKKLQGVAEEKQRLDAKCWDGYKKDGTKMKGDTRVNNCVKEDSLEEYGDTAQGQKMLTKVQKRAVDRVVSKKADTDPKYAKKNSDSAKRAWERMADLEETYDGDEFFEAYGELWYNEDEQLDEAEYQGRSVPLGKPMQGDVKKFKVYVKDPSTGNVKKVNFGDPDMKIRKSNPAARRSFRARHNCDNPGPRTKARYWSCRKW